MPHAAVLLALAAVLAPLAAPADTNHSLPGGHSCGTQGRYAPNGTYEANLRLVAARITVQLVNASSPCTASAYAAAHQVVASANCHWLPSGVNSSAACVACVALAFRDARLLCPYHRDAIVERGECRVTYHDAQLMERDSGAIIVDEHMLFWWRRVLVQDFPLIMSFQAIGFACLLFLFIQEWRGRRRGPAMELVM
uniref:Uncharacterized protein n=1 Tax=Avena sativa TaxID=4498 RepID=A0ACD5UZ11_AVESA